MRRLPPDVWLTLGLILLFTGISLVAARQGLQAPAAPPLASFSTAPDGARLLSDWLKALAYPIDATQPAEFAPPAGVGVVLLLEPTVAVTAIEWELLDAWVADGGALLIAAESTGAGQAALAHFDFEVRWTYPENTADRPLTPLLAGPLDWDSADTRPGATLDTSRADFITHLAAEGQPTLVSFESGKGRVFLSTLTFPFSNLGLQQPGNPALALNLIAAAHRSGAIWFDEWHHGVRRLAEAETGQGLGLWLRHTPIGQASLAVGLIIFLALVWQGRRFGRPLPLPEMTRRRAPLEYVTALANLQRRAGNRPAILADYRLRLKRGLGQRYRIDPHLPDEEYLRQLAACRPPWDMTLLAGLLARLNRPNPSEDELVRLAAETAAWLRRL